MQIERLSIPDVILVTPARHGDERGYFSEIYNRRIFQAAGIDAEFVQDNMSYSARPGVIRGLHYQVSPSVQGKLVRCGRGSILDVAVDIRKGSPFFGRHVTAVLSAANGSQLWVPPGFAHGFCVLEAETEVVYKVTAFYDAHADQGIAFDDPEIAIDWPVTREQAILSAKDRNQPSLAALPDHFRYQAR